MLLLDDSELVRRQLATGEDLKLTPDLRSRLRDQISTDEITPAYVCYFYDETLGEFPYLGLRTTNAETGAPRIPGLERQRKGRGLRVLGCRETTWQGV